MERDIIGHVYGKLTVTSFAGNVYVTKTAPGRATRTWECVCVCGETVVVTQSDLTGHKVTLCKTCLKKNLKKKLKALGLSEHAPYAHRITTIHTETIDRGCFSGFVEYFSKNHLLFWDTFGRPYSEETAREEWDKLK